MGNDGCYPFVFDSPDYRLSPVKPPTIVEVQLAAFAHELTLFESEAAYDANTDKPKLAVESFIPSGLFQPGGEKTEPPEAYGIFTGRILETERRVNPLTKLPFHWALVKTLGGQVDVVVDPQLITSRMVKGGVLSGSFGCPVVSSTKKRKDSPEGLLATNACRLRSTSSASATTGPALRGACARPWKR
jgi:hypothetical protein